MKDFVKDELPGVPLQEWMNECLANVPENKPFAWDAMIDQAIFARDYLAGLIDAETPDVISTHRSKSVRFPVYRYRSKGKYDRNGHFAEGEKLIVYMRGNLYDWKISVRSMDPILPPSGNTSMFRGFIDEGSRWESCYFEGFPEHLVFPAYGSDPKLTDNHRRWSAHIGNDHALWAVFKMIGDALR